MENNAGIHLFYYTRNQHALKYQSFAIDYTTKILHDRTMQSPPSQWLVFCLDSTSMCAWSRHISWRIMINRFNDGEQWIKLFEKILSDKLSNNTIPRSWSWRTLLGHNYGPGVNQCRLIHPSYHPFVLKVRLWFARCTWLEYWIKSAKMSFNMILNDKPYYYNKWGYSLRRRHVHWSWESGQRHIVQKLRRWVLVTCSNIFVVKNHTHKRYRQTVVFCSAKQTILNKK